MSDELYLFLRGDTSYYLPFDTPSEVIEQAREYLKRHGNMAKVHVSLDDLIDGEYGFLTDEEYEKLEQQAAAELQKEWMEDFKEVETDQRSIETMTEDQYREIGEIAGELKCLERLYSSICDLPDVPKEFYVQAAQVAEKRLAAVGNRLSNILKRA